MYVRDYMTRDPVVASPQMTIKDARELLRSKNFRHLPVVNEDNVLIGIVTDRDIRSSYPSELEDERTRKEMLERVEKTPISEIMTKNPATLLPDATLDDAMFFFNRHIVGAIPVVDENNKIVGIFSIRDLIKAYTDLIGLGERGSHFVALERTDEAADELSRLIVLLEQNKIPITRIIKTKNCIYLRINTINISAVKKILGENGYRVI